MLNLQRFQNNFKVTIQGGYKMIHEWSTKEGQGDYKHTLGMEYFNGSFDVDINNIEAIGRKILEHINDNNYSNMKESDLCIIDNRITWNQIEDADCNILETIEEEEAEENCYICDYDIFVSINGLELTEEELRELLPDAD